MADTVTLTEDLYDRRDPNRPAVFVAPRGATVPKAVAAALGLKVEAATKARREETIEDKAIKPAATKRAKKD